MASRPVVAEVEAIGRALAFAEDTGCPLHIVHVSTGRGVELVAEARARGVDVSCGTCPHYLWLSEHDVETLGAVAKCAPPRSARRRARAAVAAVCGGAVDMVTSDHSPSSPDLKAGRFADAWGGIAGCQTTLTLCSSEGDLALERVGRLVAGAAAERFGMPARAGSRWVPTPTSRCRLGAEYELGADELQYRHRISPWIGRRCAAA